MGSKHLLNKSLFNKSLFNKSLIALFAGLLTNCLSVKANTNVNTNQKSSSATASNTDSKPLSIAKDPITGKLSFG